ncbi:MAG: NAD(P)-dependent oxidoreductase [Candidatus Latescibacteria bacterium]|nr:NAD(P)-dependent oxidoreductase [Candidatus Latescibacterota bacterium]
MPMRYLVTGGSGFLGINLIRYLLERGHEVTSLDLLEFDYEDCRDRVDAIVGDIRKRATVDRAMQGVDIVVHCAAALPLYSTADILSTDIDGTRNVLQSALEAKVQRVIHVSSTAVYGVPDHHPLYETDPLIGVGPYGEAKIAAEELCVEYRKKGMCIPILRPKSFVGPERLGVFALLFDWARDGRNFPLPGRGDNLYQLMDVADLCDAIYLCATLDRDAVNDVFNVGAKEFDTVKNDFQAVLDRAGKGKRIIPFPEAPMKMALATLRALRLSPVYKWAYGTVSKESFVSIEKAERVLGFKPRYSNKAALLRNYEWYLANLHRFHGSSGVTHRAPWSQGILGLAKRFF